MNDKDATMTAGIASIVNYQFSIFNYHSPNVTHQPKRQDLLPRNACDGRGQIRRVLFEGVWLEHSQAGRWSHRIRRYDGRSERSLGGRSPSVARTRPALLHHGG